MVEFIIMIAILVICGLLFGKADTKKELLNQVGLDLSDRNYENKKEDEFRKYSIKAMKAVVDLDYYKAQDEREFLNFMSDRLDLAAHGRYVDDYFGGSEYKSLYLGVKPNYVKHAERVIYRRQKDIKAGNDSPLSKTVVFADKKSAKKYCEILGRNISILGQRIGYKKMVYSNWESRIMGIGSLIHTDKKRTGTKAEDVGAGSRSLFLNFIPYHTATPVRITSR